MLAAGGGAQACSGRVSFAILRGFPGCWKIIEGKGRVGLFFAESSTKPPQAGGLHSFHDCSRNKRTSATTWGARFEARTDIRTRGAREPGSLSDLLDFQIIKAALDEARFPGGLGRSGNDDRRCIPRLSGRSLLDRWRRNIEFGRSRRRTWKVP